MKDTVSGFICSIFGFVNKYFMCYTIEQYDAEPAIPEAQKQFVGSSIKEYIKNPELLISEDDAWKMINNDE